MSRLDTRDRLSWQEPDRRVLYRAVRLLASSRATTGRLGVAFQALLADLELYDDPQQGRGSWLFPDEYDLIDALAVSLQALSAGCAARRGAMAALAHPTWPEVQALARRVMTVLEVNGAGRPHR